jgi:hypothetical protein
MQGSRVVGNEVLMKENMEKLLFQRTQGSMVFPLLGNLIHDAPRFSFVKQNLVVLTDGALIVTVKCNSCFI